MLDYELIKTVNRYIKIYRDFPLPAIVCDTGFQVYWANNLAWEGFGHLARPQGMIEALAEFEPVKLIDDIGENGSVTLSGVFPFSDIKISLSPIFTDSGTAAGIIALLISADRSPQPLPEAGRAAEAFSEGVRKSVSGIFEASESAYLKSVMMDGAQWLSPHLNRIGSGAYQLLRTSANFSEYARYQNGSVKHNPETIDIFAWLRVISGAVEVIAKKMSAPVSFRIEEGAGYARVDLSTFEPALYNIINNSLFFTRENNHIEVSAYKSGGVVIEISDLGMGMDGETLQNAFRPYFARANAAGTRGAGLGLTLARLTIEAHGGGIELISKPGEGTCVTLTLPPISFSQPLPLEQGDGAAETARNSVRDRFSALYVGLMGIDGG